MSTAREPGFYWCKTTRNGTAGPDWEVAQWDGGAWWLTGWECEEYEGEALVVGARVPQPNTEPTFPCPTCGSEGVG